MRRVALAVILGLTSVSLACAAGAGSRAPGPFAAADQADQADPADPADPGADLGARAQALAQRIIILDGHVDLPFRVAKALREGAGMPPVHARAEDGDFDYERARAGGLDAPFMSIYTPAQLEAEPGASKAFAEQSIDFVLGLAAAHGDKFALALTPAEVRQNFERGLISLAMGMENGSPIEGELGNLRHFYERGVRYITLTHSLDNHICDSSYDDRHTHGGLSEFGRAVVVEMNRLGIMIDIAHVSDATFWEVIELSAVPVIASHSSARAFTPGFERNMSDEMIQALAAAGGVIQINFGGAFLSDDYRTAEAEGRPLPPIDAELVADHIEHVIALVGASHVGLGSDFDGVGDSLPEGLKDVSGYPNLLRILLERGHSPEQIELICSGNVLRVWQAVEDYGAARR